MRAPFGFFLYQVFMVSWFLHLPARYSFLGAVRFDLLLFLIILGSILMTTGRTSEEKNPTTSLLWILAIYFVVTLPFTEYPGSVLKFGLEKWIKAAAFFIFTVALVDTPARLKRFLMVFLFCQVFRILEPLHLHITEGYWGAKAFMSNWEFMARLSGAPSDVINPNGLAFLVLTVLPFGHFLSGINKKLRILYIVLLPLLLYTMTLTGSRSGFLGLFVLFAGFFFYSQRKGALLFLGLLIFGVGITQMSPGHFERYLSIFSSDTLHGGTADGRMEGIKQDMAVALRKPFFGHGLGTSAEVNWNFRGATHLAHNLYAEVAQELGFIGLGLFLLFLRSIYRNFKQVLSRFKQMGNPPPFFLALSKAMVVWFFMNLFFSLFSYGLCGFEWYLFAGLAVCLERIMKTQASSLEPKEDGQPSMQREAVS